MFALLPPLKRATSRLAHYCSLLCYGFCETFQVHRHGSSLLCLNCFLTLFTTFLRFSASLLCQLPIPVNTGGLKALTSRTAHRLSSMCDTFLFPFGIFCISSCRRAFCLRVTENLLHLHLSRAALERRQPVCRIAAMTHSYRRRRLSSSAAS